MDLHVHLEGSIRPSTVIDLAEKNNLTPPAGIVKGRYSPYASFEDFIAQYILTCGCLQAPEDFKRVAYEFCADVEAEGVRYAEVTFTVLGQAIGGNWDAPVDAVLEGFADGERDFGTQCRLVLDCVRGWHDLAHHTLEVALRHRDDGVVALGLGGFEDRSGAPFADVFRRALDGGLHSVPHAGEAEGPESIREALDLLGAERIGHGFRVLDDHELVVKLRDLRIPLEVCPTSNVATGLVPSLEEHPFPRLLEAGLVVTLNSDDPAMFASPINGEYEAARRVFGLDDEQLAELARAGARASFADENMKAQLELDIDDWLEAEDDA